MSFFKSKMKRNKSTHGGNSNKSNHKRNKVNKAMTPTKPSPSHLIPNEMRRAYSSPAANDHHPSQWSTSKHYQASSKIACPHSLSYYHQLINITLIHNKSKSSTSRLEYELHSELINGWDISHQMDINKTIYRLKPMTITDSTHIIIDNLRECLLYSFNKFLVLSSKKSRKSKNGKKKNLKWCKNAYSHLIKSMTLEQKAMLFCKCSDRKNRKYKLIHEYKDCIIGKEGVDFLVNKQICKNRKAAITLGQEFIDKGYMSHVSDKHKFKDSSNFWYKFYDEAIQYANVNLMRYSDDEKSDDEETSDDESIILSNPNIINLDTLTLPTGSVPTPYANHKLSGSNGKIHERKYNDNDTDIENSLAIHIEDCDESEYENEHGFANSSGSTSRANEITSYLAEMEGSSTDEEEDFIKDIKTFTSNTTSMGKLGGNHNEVILWLLSLYDIQELQCMMDSGFKSLIKSPEKARKKPNRYQLTMSHSYDDGDSFGSAVCTLDPTPHSNSCRKATAHDVDTYGDDMNNNGYQMQIQQLIPQGLPKLGHAMSDNYGYNYGHNNDRRESHDNELFMSYHNRMYHKISNKYSLRVKPWTMDNITDLQLKKLLKVQQMKFDTYLHALEYVLTELWNIYNAYCTKFYLNLINGLSLVEKAKLMSIGVERKNRVKNLHKYRNCFLGAQAVTFMLNAQLVETRKGGLYLGNIFYKKRWLKHVRNEHVFEDKEELFYVIIEDELENRLDELRMYRKQQQSNHVNISLDIVTSPKSPICIPAPDKTGSMIKLLIDCDEAEDSDEILYDYHYPRKSPTISTQISSTSLLPNHYSNQSLSICNIQTRNRAPTDDNIESYFPDPDHDNNTSNKK